MKRVFLLIVVPALLVALGFAQTPTASSNTDQINIEGCLGGSDGSYTVAEDHTGHIFKITTSSTDLKPHLGHDVKLMGHKAGTPENGFAVTELNMISEHCTAAAAVPVATVSTPADTITTPPAAVPLAAAPVSTVSTPADTVSASPAAAAPAPAPIATVTTPADTVSASPAAAPPAAAPPAAAPVATVTTPAETVNTPVAAAAVHPKRTSARPRKPSATPAAAAAPAEPVSTPAAATAAPAAPVSTPSETASAPAPAAIKPSTSRSKWMLVPIVVVVLLVGAAVPLYNRWRKRKLLEETDAQNLSFTKEAISDPGKSDEPGGRKAA